MRMALLMLLPSHMRYDMLEPHRRTLLRRRASLLQRRRRALTEEQELLAEREPDWEDAAALETAASVIDTLTEAEREALARIESSLRRMERGTYGECVSCGGPITEERLNLVPEADRCERCAPP
jgi:RNA polymerase-binding protein DksA